MISWILIFPKELFSIFRNLDSLLEFRILELKAGLSLLRTIGKPCEDFFYERTLEEGIEIGEMNKALETARRMKEEGDLLDKIIRTTGLSEDHLKEKGIL